MKIAISAYTPAGEGERLMQLDVLRGIALLGVLLINIDVFSGAFWGMEARLPYPMGWGGDVIFFLRQALVEGKTVGGYTGGNTFAMKVSGGKKWN